MDASEAGIIARKYFESTLNTTSFTMETIKNEELHSSLTGQSLGLWEIEVLLKPFYGPEKKFKIQISLADNRITSVRQGGNDFAFGFL